MSESAKNLEPEIGAFRGISPDLLVSVWNREDANLMPKKKAAKGSVQVVVFRDRLRLRWSFAGKRYTLSLELPDSVVNRKVAEAKARIIEADMAAELGGSSGAFDQTLAKYRSSQRSSSLTVCDLFDRYTEFKKSNIYPQSLLKYEGLKGHLSQFFKAKEASQVDEQMAEAFRVWLSQKLAPVTLRERIALLKACWEWGSQKKLVLAANPWAAIKVRVPRTKKKPFRLDEVQRIIEGFRQSEEYSCYADYVEFLLCSGCRIDEAIALRWKHLNESCSLVHFIESYYRGTFKGLKTDDERWIELNPRLQALLLARKAKGCNPDDLVFTSRRGKPISDQNFLKRAWKTVLSEVGVPYRKPRTTRSTFASHALESGLSPAEVCSITGHTEETLFRHYAGHIKTKPKLPDLFESP